MGEAQPQSDYGNKVHQAVDSVIAVNDLANITGAQQREGYYGVTESEDVSARLEAHAGQSPATEDKKVRAVVDVRPSRADKPGENSLEYFATAYKFDGEKTFVDNVGVNRYKAGGDSRRKYEGDQGKRLGAAILRRAANEVGPVVKKAADDKIADIQAAKKSLDQAESATKIAE